VNGSRERSSYYVCPWLRAQAWSAAAQRDVIDTDDMNDKQRHCLTTTINQSVKQSTVTSATALNDLIADELWTVASDTVYGLKDVDLMFSDEFVPRHADHAVDAAPTHAVSEHIKA